MSDKIQNHELYVLEHGAVIKTRCPKAKITDVMVAQKALYLKLSEGDEIRLLTLNFQRNTVYWKRTYIVAERSDYLDRSENLHGDVRHEETFKVRVAPETDWIHITHEPGSFKVVNKGPAHKWWVLDADGGTVARGLDEATARAIAAGDMAVPEAA